MSDDDLVEGVAGGDGDALDALFRRHAGPLFRLALQRLGDRQAAEDAVQDTFAAVWRSAGGYARERGSGGAWLHGVARHSIADRARQREAPAPPAPAADREDDVANRAHERWIAADVHRAVAALADDHRRVIELAYWAGLSQQEIAERLDLPLGTVKSRTRAALRRLADILDEAGER